MYTLLAVSCIIGIVATIGGSAINIYQLGIQHMSASVRNLVNTIARDIGQALKSGRADLNKLISLLQSKNQGALMTYLYNNPVISKRLDDIQKNSDVIAEIQAQQSNLENEINQLLNELNMLGSTNSISGSIKDKQRAKEIEQELEDKRREYYRLGNQAKTQDFSTVNTANTYTADIDARSQNIKGGLV